MGFTDQFATFEKKEIPLILRKPIDNNSMPKEMHGAIGRGFYPGRVFLGEMVSPFEWGTKLQSLGIPYAYQKDDGAWVSVSENGEQVNISDIVGIFVREEYVPAFLQNGGIIYNPELSKLISKSRWQEDDTGLYHEFSSSKADSVIKAMEQANIPFTSSSQRKGFFGKVFTIRIESESAAYGLICHGASFKNSEVLNSKYDEIRNPEAQGWKRSSGGGRE